MQILTFAVGYKSENNSPSAGQAKAIRGEEQRGLQGPTTQRAVSVIMYSPVTVNPLSLPTRAGSRSALPAPSSIIVLFEGLGQSIRVNRLGLGSGSM
jgi:hypothetical protein